MKKILSIIIILTASLLNSLAGDVTLEWDTYVQSSTNAPVDLIKIYAVPGTNTVFTAGNANATVTLTTPVANSSVTVPNLSVGAWTFVATAVSTSAGLESSNSNTVWCNVPPKGVVNLRISQINP
ncbi:MAG TPA: hypothetical protein PLC59_04715 [Bacteroidales bacterium]|jgi:hypothetical protein|nr:hypothetical protein [Bacteroidales bacterium]HQI45336.1 hypothetical protein [Bacteroidales bacterium]